MKKTIVFVAGLCLLAFTNSYSLAADSVNTEEAKQSIALSGELLDGVRVIKVTASRYKYEPDPVVVKLGEKVRIIATTLDVAHGFALSEFNINLSIKPDETQTTEFTADKAGEFTIDCTVYCGPGHMNMEGRFIVLR